MLRSKHCLIFGLSEYLHKRVDLKTRPKKYFQVKSTRGLPMFLKHNTQFASIRTISVSEQFARNNYIFLNY